NKGLRHSKIYADSSQTQSIEPPTYTIAQPALRAANGKKQNLTQNNKSLPTFAKLPSVSLMFCGIKKAKGHYASDETCGLEPASKMR
ncbi:MAG: hypothetical protein ACI4RV_05535, partial [Eubacteriales bacterium]